MTDATAPPAPPAAASTDEPAAHPRRPWVAGLLTILAPGLGHVYAGRARRGIIVGIAWFPSFVLGLWASLWMPHPALRMATVALVIAAYLAIVWDAVASAAAAGRAYAPRGYNRAAVYVGYALVAAVAANTVVPWTLARVVRAYSIPAAAMRPTLLPGDYLMASPRAPRPLRRGAPVVYRASNGVVAVSRVVGTGGDTLEMRGGRLVRNGEAVEEPYAVQGSAHDQVQDGMAWHREHLARPPAPGAAYAPTMDAWGPLVVPPGHVFVMGDNRDQSLDSRHLGFVPHEAVLGRPVWIYYSRDAFDGIRWGRLGRAVR